MATLFRLTPFCIRFQDIKWSTIPTMSTNSHRIVTMDNRPLHLVQHDPSMTEYVALGKVMHRQCQVRLQLRISDPNQLQPIASTFDARQKLDTCLMARVLTRRGPHHYGQVPRRQQRLCRNLGDSNRRQCYSCHAIGSMVLILRTGVTAGILACLCEVDSSSIMDEYQFLLSRINRCVTRSCRFLSVRRGR